MRTVVHAAQAGVLALALAACSGSEPAGPPPPSTVSPPAGPAAAPVPAVAATTVRVPAGSDTAPFDQARRLEAPPGWTVTVWARVAESNRVDSFRYRAGAVSGKRVVAAGLPTRRVPSWAAPTRTRSRP